MTATIHVFPKARRNFFPVKIKIISTGEILVARTLQDLPKYPVSFQIIETQVAGQRK